MKSYVVALSLAGSLLGGCSATTKSASCIGAPAIPLRPAVINTMNRSELIKYNRYKSWWQENCKH